MNKMTRYNAFGTLFIAIGLFGHNIITLPDFVLGFCLGVGIALNLIGAYAIRHNITKLREFKKNLVKKMF
jgi:hypothetical protein